MTSTITKYFYQGFTSLSCCAKHSLSLSHQALQKTSQALTKVKNSIVGGYLYYTTRENAFEILGWSVGGGDTLGGRVGILTTGIAAYTLSSFGYWGGATLSIVGGVAVGYVTKRYFDRQNPPSSTRQRVQRFCSQAIIPLAVTGGLLFVLPSYLSQLGTSWAPYVSNVAGSRQPVNF